MPSKIPDSHEDYNSHFYAKKTKDAVDAQLLYGQVPEREPISGLFDRTLKDGKSVDEFVAEHKTLSSNMIKAYHSNKAFSNIDIDNDPKLKELESQYIAQQNIVKTAFNKYKAVLDGNDSEVSGLKADLEKKKEAYYKALEEDTIASDYAEPLKKINEEILDTEKKVNQYKTEKESIENEKIKLNDEKTMIGVQKEDLQKKVDSNTQRITDFTSQIDAKTGEISSKKAEISTLESKTFTEKSIPENATEEDKAKINKENESIRKQKAENQAAIAKLKQDVQALEAQKAEFERQKTELETENNTLTTKINELTEKENGLDKEIENATNKQNEIQEQIDIEEGNLRTLNSQKNQLEEEINRKATDATKKAMEAYNSAKESFDAKVKDLSSKYLSERDTAESQCSSISKSIAQRKLELIELKKQKEAEEKAKAEQEAAAQAAAAAGGAGSSGGADGASGASGSGDAGSSGGSGSSDGSGGVSEAELQRLTATMNESKQAMDNAKNDVISAFDGTSSSLKSISEKRNIAWDGFIKALENKDPKLAKSINNIKKKYDDAGKELAQAEKDLFEAQTCLPEKEVALSKATVELSSLESAETKLNGVSDTNLSAEKKTELKNLKNKLSNAIKAKKSEVKKLQDEISKAKNSSKLESKRDKLKTKYTELEKEITAKMKEAAEIYKDDVSIESYRKAFSDANEEFNSTQEKEITAKKDAYTKAADKYKTDADPVHKAQAAKAAGEYNFSGGSNLNLNFDFNETLTASQRNALGSIKNIFLQNRARYEKVAAATGIPAELICAIHYRESGCKFNTYLHNGDPLGKPTVHVPKGKLFYDWESSAKDALSGKGRVSNNDLGSLLDFAERYNGLGYRRRGVVSPYVYAGTSKYTGGMYVRDGVYSASAQDKRVGVAVIMKHLCQA